MKKLITLLAVTASFAVLSPASVQARDDHGHSSSRSVSHNCGSCGSPVYRERTFNGYDRHGHPVFGYRTVGHSCRSSSGHGGGHGSGHGSSSGGHISLPGFHFDFGGSGRH
ncbi:MAG: hypothetical protein H7A55_20715 [Verrucomicrobiaceae bacterium]|nr:hypothetical protein [Verrucomicrobiaceae bacterium]